MPSARLGLRVARIHVPLMRLGLCLDCEECFEIGSDSCPACGSETWMPLARFLETAHARRLVHLVDSGSGHDRTASTHHLIIVARDREALYRHFADSLAGNPTISVVLDRRHRDRRTDERNGAPDRRRGDRRWRKVDDQLRLLGWAVVRVDRTASSR